MNTSKDRIAKSIIPVATGVWGMKELFVNFYMIQSTENNDWVLVDSGLKWSAGSIKRMAEYLFGENAKPKTIILTHGHFDHIGSVAALAEEWDVPVYAHYLEIPYLTGKSSYAPADPTTGGGMMATMSFLYPSSPINIWNRINAMPPNDEVPFLSDWKYIHTPGHTPGHISLFRESDKVLIAGDAFVTTKAESAIAIALETKVVSGPPKYFTYDWTAGEQSVKALAALEPKVAATGHGKPMRGDALRDGLLNLSQNFKTVAVPEQGRYIDEAAVPDANGFIYIPKSNYDVAMLPWKAAAVSLVVALGFVLNSYRVKKHKKKLNGALLDVEYNY